METVEDDLAEWFSDFNRAVIVGVGNPLRNDDSVGVEIVKTVKEKISKDTILFIESESVPENFMQPIIEFDPSHILIIDAALLGLDPGSMKFTNSLEGSKQAVSSHQLPIQVCCNYLKTSTEAKIGLVLIQPENIDLGEELSPKLKKAAKKLIDFLLSILS